MISRAITTAPAAKMSMLNNRSETEALTVISGGLVLARDDKTLSVGRERLDPHVDPFF